ncbi:MAG: FtsW/RodA/SpoVE family cell cycle protein, partial [Planctomycetaceae bacterium]|nr:FtsW/RodA/SpoVE family cell cycle protein [Planctomycetaceae bacterium]
LVLQAAVNACVVTALLPPKGIPHPLISYGGSSLLFSLVAVGVILSLSRDAHKFQQVPEWSSRSPVRG